MTIVTAPYVLDVAGAYLDEPPDYSADVLSDWVREKAEQFDADWPAVQAILRQLEVHGIYLLDVNPGGVRVRGSPGPSDR